MHPCPPPAACQLASFSKMARLRVSLVGVGGAPVLPWTRTRQLFPPFFDPTCSALRPTRYCPLHHWSPAIGLQPGICSEYARNMLARGPSRAIGWHFRSAVHTNTTTEGRTTLATWSCVSCLSANCLHRVVDQPCHASEALPARPPASRGPRTPLPPQSLPFPCTIVYCYLVYRRVRFTRSTCRTRLVCPRGPSPSRRAPRPRRTPS
eukprot:8302929-Pyramimonas_sp.AAC.1